MTPIRDSFIHFISDNLPSLTIHPLRSDPNDPTAGIFAMNAVNVRFGNANYGVSISTQHVNIDVCYDSELDAVSAMNQVWTVLGAAFFCPLLDYTDPAHPVQLNTNHIYWNSLGVNFRSVRSDFYCHYTCSLKLLAHLG